MARTDDNTYLLGLRVLEVANELGEYAGKLLAGLGADVVKVEPPMGEETRAYGPFLDDVAHADRSLYFWHYNHGKRGVVLDLDTDEGVATFRRLAALADVVLDTRPRGYLESRGLGADVLREENPGLIYAKITPFGEDGPWADYQGSDLVHLALGGMMMNSGYDPDPNGDYDTPPIAPQMWHAYHIAGEQMVMSIIAAACHRLVSGRGQYLTESVHQAAAACTESDHPMWISLRIPYIRQTGRHASPILTTRAIAPTKDGRYVMPYTTYVQNFPDSWPADIATLREYGMQGELDAEEWEDPGFRVANAERIANRMDKLIGRTLYEDDLWREMLAKGLTWAPVRNPEENVIDEHWLGRHTYTTVEHPELGRSFTYVGARWYSEQVEWSLERRAPLLGEHNAEVEADWKTAVASSPAISGPHRAGDPETSPKSVHGTSLPLAGVRVVDLSWMLASAGAGRFLSAMGAEVIKVEHMSRLDGMRFAGMPFPDRAERDAATAPMSYPQQTSVNQSANFNEINTGKLGLSLDLKSARGKQVLEDLIRTADFVIEGYSPGTMDRMGLGFERLREVNSQIIYVQQSGLGQHGAYGGAKAFGPTAQAFSGLTEMSGLPNPWPPAGIGYSYLDWFGAYNMATAMVAALYRRDMTGQGCWIDSSQVEMGIYLQGSALLDYSVNGRTWRRYGNRSPFKAAAPHGAYRAEGKDRWVAISAFTESHWLELLDVLDASELNDDERFSTLHARLQHQDELDRLIEVYTKRWDRYDLMHALQARGVPAGVTQDAHDKVELDPQLRALAWLVELEHSEFGSWPAKDFPVTFSETPTHIGGPKNRHSPCYGEDTDDVLTRVLGMSEVEIAELREQRVV